MKPLPLWNNIAVAMTLFPRAAARERRAAANRWRKALTNDPEVMADLIRLGGVLLMTPPTPGGPSVEQLAYEAGRRDFALQLMALAGLTPYDLKQIMDDHNE